MKVYKKTYRIESIRKKGWDYGSNAAYFVTICTKNRAYYFGEIENDQMHLNPLGKSADQCWREIPNHFPFVILGKHVIMPDHVHGIIIINKEIVREETQDFASLLNFTFNKNNVKNQNVFGPQSKNLGSIIRGFKIGVTKQAKILNMEFAWQPRYHDQIITNQEAFKNISEYIQNNPKNWKFDRNNSRK